MPVLLYWHVPFFVFEDKSWERGDLTGAYSPIMLHVTVRLGGSMLVALNALALVPMTGGGGTLLRSRPVDSLDARFRNRRLVAIEPLAIRSTIFHVRGQVDITLWVESWRQRTFVCNRSSILILELSLDLFIRSVRWGTPC